MINRIIDLSARHRLLVLVLALAAAFFGWYSLTHTPIDALPELSDNQVIIYSRWDRSPDQIENQVTYPIVSALLGAPGIKSVRGQSDFGSSFVYAIFDDDVDLYWARSRTLEYLAAVLPRLPEGVRTELGPDATALGWVFQYVLIDRSNRHSLADLRSYQDWYLAYYLRSVPGVAEVASVGGFVRQYQVSVDPDRLRAFSLSVQSVVEALRRGNRDTGGRVVESAGTEFMVRGLGYAHSLEDLEEVLVKTSQDGTPVRVRDIARVAIGPEMRRGVADLDGLGDVVSGIVVMRQGQNALEVIDRVKAKLAQIQPSLPPGVEILPVYDRSELIHRSIGNLKLTILEVTITVAIVIILFLWHFPSIVVPLFTIPVAVLVAFIPLRWFGVSSNIMSLGGIAIAIGALVDAGIVVAEQTHKRLEEWYRSGCQEDHRTVIIAAVKQVGRSSFFALLVIAVSFLPILSLQAQEGRLFRPLAYTKSFSMLVAAVLAISVDPALRLLFIRRRAFGFRPAWLCRAANSLLVGQIHQESEHRFMRAMNRTYGAVVAWSLRNTRSLLAAALVLMTVTCFLWPRLGSEFMPPLDEGTLLYMPTVAPGISIAEAQRLLVNTDRILKQFPEVDHVLGKAGRADSSTDPAPLSMMETTITLRPISEWPERRTWYSPWAPEWLKPLFRPFAPDRLSKEELVDRMNRAVTLPGVSNAWSMPIRGRIDMLSTGMRTPVGLKVSGANINEIQRISSHVEALLRPIPGTRAVFAERAAGGSFVDIAWNRPALARYGLSIDDAQSAIQYAIGGEPIGVVFEGRERYTVNVRYMRGFRDSLETLPQVLVPSPDGKRQIPIAELAAVRVVSGPAMLRNENGLLTGYVYVDVDKRDIEGYIRDAQDILTRQLDLPTGYTVAWSGQYEGLIRMKQRLRLIVPATLAMILLLIYLNLRSLSRTLLVFLAVPFSAIGAVWLLYLTGYHVSIAVWVGLIALLGVDAETGVFMLLYLDHAFEAALRKGRLYSRADVERAILDGAAGRLRPKLMTVTTMFVGLIPIMWSTGSGSDVMKRIATPLIGGILTSFLLELIIYPSLYYSWIASRHPLSSTALQRELSSEAPGSNKIGDFSHFL